MKKINLKDGLTSLVIGLVLTLTGMMVGLLMAMFQSKSSGIRYGFFKTVYFKSQEQADGSISINLGLTKEYAPIILSLLITTVFIYLFLTTYKRLDTRKKHLQ